VKSSSVWRFTTADRCERPVPPETDHDAEIATTAVVPWPTEGFLGFERVADPGRRIVFDWRSPLRIVSEVVSNSVFEVLDTAGTIDRERDLVDHRSNREDTRKRDHKTDG